MGPPELLAFLRSHRLAVLATSSSAGEPRAAVMGFAVTDRFEFVFDTLASTRKVPNLRENPRVALVVGGLAAGDERTAQVEGRVVSARKDQLLASHGVAGRKQTPKDGVGDLTAELPVGAELGRLKAAYFGVFPEGRDRQAWPGILYFRVRPVGIRYSDFNVRPAAIAEFDGKALG